MPVKNRCFTNKMNKLYYINTIFLGQQWFVVLNRRKGLD